MNILIPMSGAGRRFSEQGYTKPKPLIEFFNKTMIEHVLENLGHQNRFTLCVLKDHYDSNQQLFESLKTVVAELNIVLVEKITRGAAETCLLAKEYIIPDEPLMIANCDQMMVWNQTELESFMSSQTLDGVIFVFDSDSVKNSYVELNQQGFVTRTAEKQVISNYATTGIYVWTKGKDFVNAAEKMIEQQLTQAGEYYVCPVYNENIANGAKIAIWRPTEHWPIGTPDDLDAYIKAHSYEDI